MRYLRISLRALAPACLFTACHVVMQGLDIVGSPSLTTVFLSALLGAGMAMDFWGRKDLRDLD